MIEGKNFNLENYVYNEFKFLNEKYGINMAVINVEEHSIIGGLGIEFVLFYPILVLLLLKNSYK